MLHLRHPLIASPYFLELYETWEHWRELVSKPIIYDEYFDDIGSDQLIKYLTALITHAKGRPVIQECRTICRINAIKKKLGGFHLYLWRNPWDQWWSYKATDYFDTTSQLILNAPIHPEAITRLKKEIGFAEFHHDDISQEFSHFAMNRLSANNSYFIFYLLWCLGLLEGMANADLLLNIDALSDSPSYMEDIKKQLLDFNVTGIDFSDCSVPQTYYRDEDKAFFSVIEDRVHGILLLSGYSQEQLTRLQGLRHSSEPKLWASSLGDIPPDQLLSNGVRAREIVLRHETENADRLNQNAKQLGKERKHSEWLQNEWDASRANEDELRRHISLGQEQIVQLSERLGTQEQEQEGLLRHVAQREKEIEELRRIEEEGAARERVLSQNAIQSRQELEGLWRNLAQREKEFGEQLLRVRDDADGRLQHAQDELRRLEQERAARERVLSQNAIQSRQELEGLLRNLAQREKEFGEQLLQFQQDAERDRAEQARAEKALSQEIAGLQSEIQALNHAQQLQAQQHGFELTTKQDELNRLIQTCAALEAQLKAQILSEQQTSLQLRQTIAQVKQNLAITHASLSWRMTAPLRKMASFIAPRKGPGHSSSSVEPVETTVSESQSTKVQSTSQASMKPIMLPSAPATNLNGPAIAATLDDLLARHDQAFIHCAYQTLLGRDPDEEGFNYYVGRLRTGIPKIQILGQLRRSEEGRDYAANLPQLDAAIRRYRWAQKPIIGWLVRLFTRVEGNNTTERKLRSLESQLFLLGEENMRRFHQMEKALTGLHHLVADQLEQIKVVIAAMGSTTQAEADIPALPPPRPIMPFEPKDLKQFSLCNTASNSLTMLQSLETIGSHTAGIFAAIKEAISTAYRCNHENSN
jgi:hypothetical protein